METVFTGLARFPRKTFIHDADDAILRVFLNQNQAIRREIDLRITNGTLYLALEVKSDVLLE